MAPIQQGQRVHFFCSSYLSNGECIDADTSESVRMVAGMTAKGNEFSKAVSHSLLGMSVDESKQFNVPARFAFGEKDPGKIFRIPLNETPAGDIGDEVDFEVNHRNQGQVLSGTLIRKDNKFSYIDTNHPLAGEPLTVKIRVISFE